MITFPYDLIHFHSAVHTVKLNEQRNDRISSIVKLILDKW